MKNIIFDKEIYILENNAKQKIAVAVYQPLVNEAYSSDKHRTDLYTTIKSLEDLHEFMIDIDFELTAFQTLREIIDLNASEIKPSDLKIINKYEDYIKALNNLKKELNKMEDYQLSEI